jgi:hypothetical protein
MAPVNVEVRETEEAAVDKKEQEAVDEKEAEVDKNASGEVFDVDLDSDAGRDVTDDGLRHAIDTDGLGGKGILQQANGGPCKGAGDWIAARDGEVDCDNEREIKDCEAGERSREERLQQDRAQRHQYSNGRGEAVLLELSSGCVAAGRHKESERQLLFFVWCLVLLVLEIAIVEGPEVSLSQLRVAVYEALQQQVVKLLGVG